MNISLDSVYLEKNGPIATLFLNRPDKKNALNYDMWCKIPELLETAESDPTIKGLVIRGVNDVAFSAGADINEFETLRFDKEQSLIYDAASARANNSLAKFKKPTIALIQGFCIGGGAGIALACDFRFSDSNGRFGITPSKLGLVYETPETKRIVDLVGPSRTKEILMTGKIMDAKEALQIRLVDRVYNPNEIIDETYDFMYLIAGRAQQTVRAAKQIVRDIQNGATENTSEIQSIINEVHDSEDYKEGVRAFIEKRKPNFTFS